MEQAKRTHNYELGDVHILQLEHSERSLTPEQNLWASVLERAIRDLKAEGEAITQERQQWARRWLSNSDMQGMGSLSWCLDAFCQNESERRFYLKEIKRLLDSHPNQCPIKNPQING